MFWSGKNINCLLNKILEIFIKWTVDILSMSSYLLKHIFWFNQRLKLDVEMFYLNTIEQLDQLEVCLPNSRLLDGIPTMVVFQNLRWNSNKTSLKYVKK